MLLSKTTQLESPTQGFVWNKACTIPTAIPIAGFNHMTTIVFSLDDLSLELVSRTGHAWPPAFQRAHYGMGGSNVFGENGDLAFLARLSARPITSVPILATLSATVWRRRMGEADARVLQWYKSIHRCERFHTHKYVLQHQETDPHFFSFSLFWLETILEGINTSSTAVPPRCRKQRTNPVPSILWYVRSHNPNHNTLNGV